MTGRRLTIAAIGLVAVIGMSGTAVATTEAKKKPLTKQEWIRKADKICTAANKQLEPLIEEHFGDRGGAEDPSADAIEAYAKAFVKIARKHVAKIRKLRPPTADKATVDELLDAEEAAIDAIEEDPQLFLTEDPFVEVSGLAQDYGLQVCGAESTD